METKKLAEEKRKECQVRRQKNRKIINERLKALFFNKKNLEFEYSTNQLIGTNVDGVIEELKEAGFNNYKTISIKDIVNIKPYA